MRVLVTDDSAFMRRAIRSMLESEPGFEVVGVARNGREAVEMAQQYKPDAITLDIEMPEMDGLTALRHIMRTSPTAVLMLSSLTTEGSHAALQALKLGAADVLAKDMSQISLSVTNIRDELIERIKVIGASPKYKKAALGEAPPPIKPTALPSYRRSQFDVICIGSSTGGPPVLETILGPLSAKLSTPIVVAQHMPKIFTLSMAQRLDELCGATVVHAEDRMPLERGKIYIAPGGLHTHIHKDGLAKFSLRVNDRPTDAPFKPSVDALFASAAEATGRRTLAVVLTGIGSDGLIGARDLHAKGAPILAQSQETCVVYGMPKAVTQAAIIDASLDPEDIGKVIFDCSVSALAA